MASVLFTALALIAAGQAQVPAAPAESGRLQNARTANIVAEAGPRAKNHRERS